MEGQETVAGGDNVSPRNDNGDNDDTTNVVQPTTLAGDNNETSNNETSNSNHLTEPTDSPVKPTNEASDDHHGDFLRQRQRKMTAMTKFLYSGSIHPAFL